jgi:hypothetical protein
MTQKNRLENGRSIIIMVFVPGLAETKRKREKRKKEEEN